MDMTRFTKEERDFMDGRLEVESAQPDVYSQGEIALMLGIREKFKSDHEGRRDIGDHVTNLILSDTYVGKYLDEIADQWCEKLALEKWDGDGEDGGEHSNEWWSLRQDALMSMIGKVLVLNGKEHLFEPDTDEEEAR